jgi:hypothetical protein
VINVKVFKDGKLIDVTHEIGRICSNFEVIVAKVTFHAKLIHRSCVIHVHLYIKKMYYESCAVN